MNRQKAAHYVRQTTIATLLFSVGAAAFRLSYDGQVRLASGSGIDTHLAGLYPICVDAVILLTTLIAVWSRPQQPTARRYIWIALAVWTATSVLGNAIHVIRSPAEQITEPLLVAIAVNTVPALALFVAIHLATTMAFRPLASTRPAPVMRPAVRRSITTVANLGPTATAPTQVHDDELLRLSNDENLTIRQIAERVGLGKTTVSDRLKNLRTASE